jgi:hypothetical protein
LIKIARPEEISILFEFEGEPLPMNHQLTL